MIASLYIAAAVAAGLGFGLGFGYLQEVASRINARRQAEGKLHSGWSLMPGSAIRVAYLLIALVIAQVVCPVLFHDGVQWCVSGGLVAGYGIMQYRQLMRRRNELAR